jgi:hypothetical protein
MFRRSKEWLPYHRGGPLCLPGSDYAQWFNDRTCKWENGRCLHREKRLIPVEVTGVGVVAKLCSLCQKKIDVEWPGED